MAQLDYYATFDESLAMLADIFARGDIRAYPDVRVYDEPAAASYAALTPELRTQLKEFGSVFLAGTFSTHPPLFIVQTKGPNAGKYLLFDGNGGPHLCLDLARERILDGTPQLVVGTLQSQAEYQLEPGRYEKASQAVKDAFADVARRMKKHMVRRQGLWIGREALKLVDVGQLQLPERSPGRSMPADKAVSSSSRPPAPVLPRAAEPA